MHHITRSHWYTKKINQFIRSDEDEFYLELYPSEVDRVQKNYPDLTFFMLDMVKAHAKDERYHVLVQK